MFSQKADAGWPGFGRLRSNSKSGWSTYRSRSALVSATRFLSTFADTPFGSLNTTGCE